MTYKFVPSVNRNIIDKLGAKLPKKTVILKNKSCQQVVKFLCSRKWRSLVRHFYVGISEICCCLYSNNFFFEFVFTATNLPPYFIGYYCRRSSPANDALTYKFTCFCCPTFETK